jgi:hypothetical protein
LRDGSEEKEASLPSSSELSLLLPSLPFSAIIDSHEKVVAVSIVAAAVGNAAVRRRGCRKMEKPIISASGPKEKKKKKCTY